MSTSQKAQEYYLPKVGSYNNLQVREVNVPKPRASEVLVKVHAVSLQYRDLLISSGNYLSDIGDNIVPCSDMAGEVVSVGEDVAQWKQGDRVCANFATEHLFGPPTPVIVASSLGGQAPGVLTEYRTFPAHALVKIPHHLSYVQASTLPCAALTAYNALHGPIPVKAGDYVLVQGTGGVSTFALQFAVASGATVIVTSSSREKLCNAARLGAKHFINYRETPDWEKEVLEITGGEGVHHIVEVGGPNTLAKSIASARYGGNIHFIGLLDKGNTGNNRHLLGMIPKGLIMRGIFIGSVNQFKDMNRLIEANPSETEPVIDKVFPFSEAIAAFAHLESQKHMGKVVIEVFKSSSDAAKSYYDQEPNVY